MARFSRLDVLNAIVDLGIVPVFYEADLEVAKNVVKACADGGARVVEFTNRGDLAPEVFKELVPYFRSEAPDVMLGVGSVIDEATAALYISYGANFVVGPLLNETVARMCNRRKIPYSPGCGTATEISSAEELGVEIVKIFPGDSVGGPEFVRAVLGPCPWTRMMPTGGVDTSRDSINEWFSAGVTAVGIGSKLITRDLVRAARWDELSANVAQVIAWIREARGEPLFKGVEHWGVYANRMATAEDIASWYQQRFGLEVKPGRSAIFLAGAGSGRIEVMKEAITDRCHVAVQVSDFDRAVAALQAQGVALQEPRITADSKLVYLRETDPVGNLVHLIWLAKRN